MKLINAQERNSQAPETFLIPEAQAKISVGNFVKIGFENDVTGERFWVEITSINKTFIAGRIDNYLNSDLWGFDYNDRIVFYRENILDIYKSKVKSQ